jgi:hypothetical protein
MDMSNRFQWNQNAGRELAKTAMENVRRIAEGSRCPVHDEPVTVGPLNPEGGFTIGGCCEEAVKAAKAAIAKELD